MNADELQAIFDLPCRSWGKTLDSLPIRLRAGCMAVMYARAIGDHDPELWNRVESETYITLLEIAGLPERTAA